LGGKEPQPIGEKEGGWLKKLRDEPGKGNKGKKKVKEKCKKKVDNRAAQY